MTEQEILSLLIHSMEKIRSEKNLSQSEMAECLDMSVSMYKKTIAGQRSGAGLLYTAHKLGMMAGIPVSELLDIPATTEKNRMINHILSTLRTLSTSQLHYIHGIVEFEHAFMPHVHHDQENYITVLSLTGNMEDGMIYDSSNVFKINAAAYKKIYGSSLDCGIQVTSNHLNPVYYRGDILLVSQMPPRHGDTGIFIDKETQRAYIRKLKQGDDKSYLEPLTHHGHTITVDCNNIHDMERWIKFGYVLTKIRNDV